MREAAPQEIICKLNQSIIHIAFIETAAVGQKRHILGPNYNEQFTNQACKIIHSQGISLQYVVFGRKIQLLFKKSLWKVTGVTKDILGLIMTVKLSQRKSKTG